MSRDPYNFFQYGRLS